MADAVLLLVLNLFPAYIGLHYMIITRKNGNGRRELFADIQQACAPSFRARRRLILLAWFLLWIVLNISYAVLQRGSDTVRVFGMLFIAFVLVLETLFVAQEENSIKQYQEISTRILGSQAEYYERQYQAIAAYQDVVRRQRHEWKNRNLMLLSLARQRDCDGIIRFLEEEQKEPLLQKMAVSSGNFTIDAVLNYEIDQAEMQNIVVKTDISVPDEMDINGTILCGILGNAMDNAIDASMHLPVSMRRIELLLRVEKRSLFIEVKNRFDGVVACRDGQLLSRKEDSANHGIGIRVMEEMIRRVDGTLETVWDQEWFTLRIIIYHAI